MREIRHSDVIVLEDRPIALPAILAAASLVFAVGLTSHVPALLAGEKEAIGIVLGCLLCAFGAVLLFRRDRFVFDGRGGDCGGANGRWRAPRRRGRFRRYSRCDLGINQRRRGRRQLSRRVADQQRDGAPDRDLFWPRRRLGSDGGPDSRDHRARGERPAGGDTAALLEQGRTIDAVRQLRETEGLDLAQAKARVDATERGAD